MAGNMVYSIQLQLRVDDSQLDATIAKLGTLKKAAKDIHVRTAGNLPRRLKLPEEDIIARSARKWKQRNLDRLPADKRRELANELERLLYLAVRN